MLVFPDQRFGRPDLAVVHAVILRQFNRRLKPKLRLPVCVMDVHMKPGFFARKEKEPEAVLAKNCWTHGLYFRQLTLVLTGAIGVRVKKLVRH